MAQPLAQKPSPDAPAADGVGATTQPREHAAQSADAAEPRWLTVEQQVAWRAFLLGSARLNDALTRQLERDAGISLSEYEILVRLSEAPDHTIRMSELAASLLHSRSRLTHTVTRLERQGLVRRETCLADGRGVNCAMTETGWQLLRSAAPGHVRAVRENLVDLLSDEHFLALGQAMATVARGPVPEDQDGPRTS